MSRRVGNYCVETKKIKKIILFFHKVLKIWLNSTMEMNLRYVVLKADPFTSTFGENYDEFQLPCEIFFFFVSFENVNPDFITTMSN